MSISVCPSCRAEYVAGISTCADCDVALVDPDEIPKAKPLPDDTELSVFELDEWAPEERQRLEMLLIGEGIAHEWEAASGVGAGELPPSHAPQRAHETWRTHSTLLVSSRDEERVDELLDDVEFPDQLDPIGEGDAPDDGSDERSFELMASLFDASDRLMNRPNDPDAVLDIAEAADEAEEAPVPFGIDPPTWARVRELSTDLREMVEAGADETAIKGSARDLRTLLRAFV